jgi:hypothetical protein
VAGGVGGMMSLRLLGTGGEDLRAMAIDWWASPLAVTLLRTHTGLGSIALELSWREDAVIGRLTARRPIARELAVLSRRFFDAPIDALDHDPAFTEAFGPFCPPTGSAVFARFTLDSSPYPRLVVERCGVRLTQDTPRPILPVLDPDVEAVLKGLDRLDLRDDLARACAALHEALSRQDRDAVRAALAPLKALLRQPWP